MHQAMAAGHLTSSLVPNTAGVPHGAYSPGGLAGGGGPGSRSPVSSPTPQPPPLPLGGVPAGHMVGGYGGGGGHVTPGHNTSGGGGGGNDGGLSSDCSDDEGSPGAGGHMPVVYPWMKKIHVTGSGTELTTFLSIPLSFFLFLFSLLYQYLAFDYTYIL
jgi:hypothetical protein